MSDKAVSPNLTGYCVKCRVKGASMGSGPEEGDKIHVTQAKNGRYMLVGWHTDCGTKMTRFLTDKKPEDKVLIDGYKKAQGSDGPTTVEKSAKSKEDTDVTTRKRVTAKKPVGKKKTGTQKKATTAKKSTAAKKPAPKKAAAKKPAVRGLAAIPISPSPEKAVPASFPLIIFAFYGKKGEKKQKLQAKMKSLGEVLYKGVTYTSPSTAALAATGASALNGWKFWKFKHGDEVFYIDALRDGGPKPRSTGKKSSGEKKSKTTAKPVNLTKLPAFSKEFGPVELPALKGDMQLPTRNSAKICAAYFVDPKKARFGHISTFLFVGGNLTFVRYNKKGVAQKASIKKLGKFKNWKEAIPTIAKTAHNKGLHRVKVA